MRAVSGVILAPFQGYLRAVSGVISAPFQGNLRAISGAMIMALKMFVSIYKFI